MQQQNMEILTQGPTRHRVSTKDSCFGADHTYYTSQYEILVDEDPPCVMDIGRQLSERIQPGSLISEPKKFEPKPPHHGLVG